MSFFFFAFLFLNVKSFSLHSCFCDIMILRQKLRSCTIKVSYQENQENRGGIRGVKDEIYRTIGDLLSSELSRNRLQTLRSATLFNPNQLHCWCFLLSFHEKPFWSLREVERNALIISLHNKYFFLFRDFSRQKICR